MFADAVIDVAALAVLGREDAQIGRLGVVRSGQVGRPANRLKQHGVDRRQHLFARRAGGEFRCFLGRSLLQLVDHPAQRLGGVQRKDPRDQVAAVLRQGILRGLPCGAGHRTTRADSLPLGLDVSRNDESWRGPAVGGLGVGDQLGIGQGAVPLVGVLRRRAKGDVRLARDQRWPG